MMEYNNYYPVQPGQPPPPQPNMMNSLTDSSPMGGQIMTPVGPPTMQPSPAPSTPQSMRHTPGPPPMPIQQHLGPGPQMHPHQQPSPHSNYHQLPQHPPISHSASPHPSSTPHAQQPPPRPATGPSPLHHQSPIHMNGPSPKLISATPLGPPSQPQTPGIGGPPPLPMHTQVVSGTSGMNHHHHPSQPHNFINGPMPHHSSPHYGHSPMNPHQQGPPHPPPPLHHHGGPPGPPQPGPPPQHPANMGGRGPPPPGSMPLHPPPPGYMMSPHPPPPMHHHQHHHPMGGPPPPPPIERGSPFYQHIPQTEFRIIELNKRLQNRPRPLRPPGTLNIDGFDECEWYKRFACDFFDDQATLSLRIPGEGKPTEYTIGRTLIPRFFKSYFDGGVTDFSIKMRNIRETTHRPGFITLDCDQTDITTKNFFRHQGSNPPLSVVVHTEGHLSVEFGSNNFDNLLIKSWRFYANQCHEYVDRSMTTVGMPSAYLTEPVTRFGLTKATFAFLKMCTIMEPMQDLMSCYQNPPRDLYPVNPKTCLRHLCERYNIVPVDENQGPPPKKRRQRKQNGGTAPGTNKRSKANSNGANAIGINPMSMGNNMMQPGDVSGVVPNLPLASQDVLVVGEPSMLGADFGDENERRITRLENNQFDPSTSMDNTMSENPNHMINQQMTENSNSGQQVDSNHIVQNNYMDQQQPTVSSNDPINQGVNDHQHQQNNIQNHNSYHESSVDGDVVQIMNYNPNCDQRESTNGNSEEKHGMTDPALGTSSNSKDMSPVSNIGNNNNNNNTNNQMNSFLLNGNDSHIAKSEIDLKQQQPHQQPHQQQPMTTTGPTPVTETEAS